MHNKTLAELADDLARGEFSSEELVRHYLGRIDSLDKDLNTYITLTPDLALDAAREADALRAKGQAGPLTGVPFAHKDIFCTRGVKTSCGSRMLDNFIAP